MAAYFAVAVAGYTLHGLRRDAENQFERATRSIRAFMASLMAVEIGPGSSSSPASSTASSCTDRRPGLPRESEAGVGHVEVVLPSGWG
jgi:hypothetical protein